jgi:hypothetical protein
LEIIGFKDVREISALSDKVDIGREIARDFEADVLLAYCGSGPDFHGVSSILCGSVNACCDGVHLGGDADHYHSIGRGLKRAFHWIA